MGSYLFFTALLLMLSISSVVQQIFWTVYFSFVTLRPSHLFEDMSKVFSNELHLFWTAPLSTLLLIYCLHFIFVLGFFRCIVRTQTLSKRLEQNRINQLHRQEKKKTTSPTHSGHALSSTMVCPKEKRKKKKEESIIYLLI